MFPKAVLLWCAVLALALGMGCTVNPQDAVPGPNQSGVQQQNDSLNSSGGNGVYTMEEVAKHSTVSDCWIVIRGAVLNLSSFASHPGGEAYLPYCGTDGTAAYESISNGKGHSGVADSMHARYQVGVLAQQGAAEQGNSSNSSGSIWAIEGDE